MHPLYACTQREDLHLTDPNPKPSMPWKPNYFTRNPLNYDTLSRRCAQFHRRKSHPPQLVADYVVANRKLQSLNKATDPNFRYGNMAQVLDIPLNVSSTQLEQELSQFVRKYHKEAVSSDLVVKAYVSSAQNVDISHAFELVQQNFHKKLKDTHSKVLFQGFKEQSGFGPVATLISVLLQKHDFQGCLKLVDNTVNSTASLRAKKNRLFAKIGSLFAAAGSFAAIDSVHSLMGSFGSIVHDISVLSMSGCVAISVAAVCLASLKVNNLDRVSWRPHTSWLHRYLHHDELIVLNQMVTFFEENHEVNVKNFHISEVRTMASLDTFDSNDYELFVPGPLVAQIENGGVDAITKLFRDELNGRKMVMNPLKEEAMFLSFWKNHGENFEWVEPDQDPAEMALIGRQ